MANERCVTGLARNSCPTCVRLAATACLVALAVGGCSKEHELSKVATDWCMTIRASQIIPVYGLTEDLQPGDIFLVQVPIDRQQRIYRKSGFLPLDNHVARLDPNGYKEFYDHSFISGQAAPMLPGDWMHPKENGAVSWQPAPHVVFPSYSFSVRRGAGLNLAVPVQGVPVGLSLLGSDAADGNISIKQARTMGVDILSLYREVQEWAQKNGDFLRYFGSDPDAKRHNYLRVVTRVFAVGELDVSLRASASQSGGLDAGVPKPVDILFPKLPDANEGMSETVRANYQEGWKTLEDIVSKAGAAARDSTGNFLPGGSLRLTGASSRTVSLKEEFQPPIILGYLGFDVVIYPGGVLGPPIPTHAILTGSYDFKQDLDANPFAAIYSDAALLAIYNTLSAAPRDRHVVKATAALDDLARFVPATFDQCDIKTHEPLVLTLQTLSQADLRPDAAPTYKDYHSFRTRLSTSIAAIENGLRVNSFRLEEKGKDLQTVAQGSELRQRIEEVLKQQRAQRDAVRTNNAAKRAYITAMVQYLEYISQ